MTEVLRKTCTKCVVDLPLSAYAKHSTHTDGLQDHCRECQRLYRAAWAAANKEKIRETNLARRVGRKLGDPKPPRAPMPDTSPTTTTSEPAQALATTADSPETVSRIAITAPVDLPAHFTTEAEGEDVEGTLVLDTQGRGMAELLVSAIVPSTTNPRRTFDHEFLVELADSIKRHGLAQPILVRPLPGNRVAETYTDRRADAPRPTHEIVAGEQRWRACGMAGLRRVPVLIRDLSDAEVLQLQLIENLKRRDLHPLEEAEGYHRLREVLGVTPEEIAAQIGKNVRYVYATLKLSELEPEARDAFYAGKLSRSNAELVAARPPNLQLQLLKEITATDFHGEGMSFRKARAHVEARYMLRLSEAPFSIRDATLVPAAGACPPCPKRTGSNPQLFADVAHSDTCTDTDCFAAKKEAHYARLRSEAEARGQTVIVGKEAREIMPSGGKLVGYTRLDDAQAHDGQLKTLRKVLGADMPTPTLVEDPHTRELVAVLPTQQVGELLRQQGIARAATPPKESAADAERKLLERFETTWRTRAIEAIYEAAAGRITGLGDAVVRIMATVMLEGLQRDQRQHVCKLLKIGTVADAEGITDAIRTCASGMLEATLLLLFVEHDMSNTVGLDGKARPATRITAVAADLELDVRTLQDKARADIVQSVVGRPAGAPPGRGRPRVRPASSEETAAAIAAQLQAATSPNAFKADDRVLITQDVTDSAGKLHRTRGTHGLIIEAVDARSWLVAVEGDLALPIDYTVLQLREAAEVGP